MSAPRTRSTRPDVARAFRNPRLFALLDARLEAGRALWVAAPAGSGKTTLLSSYLETRAAPHLWYSLDESDRDLTSLLGNLAEAGRRSLVGRRKALPHLGAEYAADLAAFARHFFGALFSQLPGGSTLVLDDAHTLGDAPAVQAVLAAIVDALTPGVRVVFLSRQPAPPTLAHAISRQLLSTCGWDELRLRHDEAEALLLHLAAPVQDSARRLQLAQLADGWAAGLVLLSAHLDALPGEASDSVDQAPQVVFDYFSTQLLAHLDGETRSFLVATALLPRMTASLAQRCSGQRAAGRILERLAREQLFVLRHPGRPPEYRLHPLLRHVLQQRLQAEESSAAFRVRCQRVARMLEDAGEVYAAGDLYLAAEDLPTLSAFAVRHAPALARQGHLETLARWLKPLATAQREQEPWLDYWDGVCLLPADTVAARALFRRAHERLVAAGVRSGAYLSWARIVESIILESGGYTELDRWIDALAGLQQRFGALLSPEVFIRVHVSLFNALVFRRSDAPRLREIERTLRRLLRVAPEVNVRFLLGANLVRYYNFVGDIAGASSVLARLRAQSDSPSLAPLTRIAWVALTSSCGWLHESAEAGLAAADRGLEVAQDLGIHLFDFYFLVQASYSALAVGKLDLAARTIERMPGTFRPERRVDAGQCTFIRGWLQLARGEVALGLASMQEAMHEALATGSPYVIVRAHHGLAQAQWRAGQVTEALTSLDAADAIAGPHGFVPVSYLVALCRAELLLSTGDRHAARAWLGRALALGRQHSLQHVPHWSPSQLAVLCAEALDAGLEVDYVRQLVAAFRLRPPAAGSSTGETWPWPVRVRALGRFQVEVDGAPLQFERKGQARPLELLRYLVVHGGVEVRVARAAEALWPDADADAARDALKTTVARLRKLIGAEAVVQVEGQLSLDPDRVWIDARVVEQALARALDGDPGQARPPELTLYRGPLLDDEDATWAIAPRERLRDRFARGLGRLSQAWVAAGRGDEAVATLSCALDAEPQLESLYAWLVRCLLALGRSAEARDVYERYRRAVVLPVGREPSPELRQLAARLSVR